MWRSSGVLYLPYIFTTRKRVYKPIVVISTKLLKMSSFCQNMACGYRERAGVNLSDIYVWRMLPEYTGIHPYSVLNLDKIYPTIEVIPFDTIMYFNDAKILIISYLID